MRSIRLDVIPFDRHWVVHYLGLPQQPHHPVQDPHAPPRTSTSAPAPPHLPFPVDQRHPVRVRPEACALGGDVVGRDQVQALRLHLRAGVRNHVVALRRKPHLDQPVAVDLGGDVRRPYQLQRERSPVCPSSSSTPLARRARQSATAAAMTTASAPSHSASTASLISSALPTLHDPSANGRLQRVRRRHDHRLGARGLSRPRQSRSPSCRSTGSI